jgi:hypothetical protein
MRFDALTPDQLDHLPDPDLALIATILTRLVVPFCDSAAALDDTARRCRPVLAALRRRMPDHAEALVASAARIRRSRGWPLPAKATAR